MGHKLVGEPLTQAELVSNPWPLNVVRVAQARYTMPPACLSDQFVRPIE